MSEAEETVEQLILGQLALMNEQLQVLGAASPGPNPTAASSRAAVTVARSIGSDRAPEPNADDATAAAQPAGRRALVKEKKIEMTEVQRGALDELTRAYCEKTKGTKDLTQEWRPFLADNRTVAGFDLLWKEMVYQIVAERSQGSKIWDVDGNEYIDITVCFGANLLGHSPDFIVSAVHEQLDKGYEVGLQNLPVGEVCELICELTGNERVTFAHSGCEADQYAIRLARAVTGKEGIVIFRNDVHGRGESVLARSVGPVQNPRTLPAAAGVLQEAVQNTIVLEFGTDEALEVIRQRADDIGALLVEPVRTRNPDLQPVEFLRELRKISTERGIALIFDEVVTGFRVHPAGCQGYFDIRADMAVYGKTVGGGMPIGVVAGKAEYLDAADGGMWAFGDDSVPQVGMTVTGGTMIKHPLAMAASRAFLRHLKEQGPTLQEDLNARTAAFSRGLNEYFLEQKIPIHLETFSSFFYPRFRTDARYEGLFSCYLRWLGIHTYMDYPCFLTTAHTDADVNRLTEAFKQAAHWMVDSDFIKLGDLELGELDA